MNVDSCYLQFFMSVQMQLDSKIFAWSVQMYVDSCHLPFFMSVQMQTASYLLLSSSSSFLLINFFFFLYLCSQTIHTSTCSVAVQVQMHLHSYKTGGDVNCPTTQRQITKQTRQTRKPRVNHLSKCSQMLVLAVVLSVRSQFTLQLSLAAVSFCL